MLPCIVSAPTSSELTAEDEDRAKDVSGISTGAGGTTLMISLEGGGGGSMLEGVG